MRIIFQEHVHKVKKIIHKVHSLVSEHLESGLYYQKKTYDLKLQQNHIKAGNFVYKPNIVNKKIAYKKLKPIWLGPLLVTQVISPMLYQVKDRC